MFGNAILCQVTQFLIQGTQQGAYLTCNSDLFTVLLPQRTFITIRVVENDRDARFGDARLTSFVNEVLLVLSPHLFCRNARLEAIGRLEMKRRT